MDNFTNQISVPFMNGRRVVDIQGTSGTKNQIINILNKVPKGLSTTSFFSNGIRVFQEEYKGNTILEEDSRRIIGHTYNPYSEDKKFIKLDRSICIPEPDTQMAKNPLLNAIQYEAQTNTIQLLKLTGKKSNITHSCWLCSEIYDHRLFPKDQMNSGTKKQGACYTCGNELESNDQLYLEYQPII